MKTHFNVRGGIGDVSEPNLNARPQDNLYLAVNSKWLSEAKIPADRTSTGINLILDMKIEDRMIRDLDEFSENKKAVPTISNFKKAVDYYRLARDFERRNREQALPLKNDLEVLLKLEDFNEFNKKSAELFLKGYDLPFNLFVMEDMKDTSKNALYAEGFGTFLPDTTAYQEPDSEKLLKILADQTIKMLVMAGLDEKLATKYVEDGISFDSKMAKFVKSTEEWANYADIYNPVAKETFENKFKSFDIASFLDQVVDSKIDQVVLAETRFFDHIEELINPSNFDELKGWLLIKFINDHAEYLSQDFREAALPFKKALYGVDKLPDQDKHAYRLVNKVLDEVVGVYYGQTYLGEKAKTDVIDLIQSMLKVYEDRIAENDWLSEATKEQALVKLKSLKLKVGYPDRMQAIFDLIEVDPEKSLYENYALIREVQVRYNLAKIDQKPDKSVWAMPGNLNNACYDPQKNDLTFPAGILQAPFYDEHQTRAANYGGIGATIGHEASHAFDNNGALFDEKGNMKNWWTKKDYEEFSKRTKAVVDIFDGIQYGPAKLNGKQVVSENIADLGGLSCAVEANRRDGGDMVELFTTYAKSWMQKQRPEAIKSEVQSDVHAPQPTRVNIPSQCQDDFYEAFDVKPSDGMWLDPEDRINIW